MTAGILLAAGGVSLVMGVPLTAATATSNHIDPLIAGPTAVGAFAGALLGSRLAPRIEIRALGDNSSSCWAPPASRRRSGQ